MCEAQAAGLALHALGSLLGEALLGADSGDLEPEGARPVRAAVEGRDYDVLKVAHHGARNGGTAVPRAVRARLHVVSVGAENTYGHPHPATLDALHRLGPVARTDLHGTIALVAEGPDGAAGAGEIGVYTVRPPSAVRTAP